MLTDEVILQMKSITKAFGGIKALSDVNLTVKRGEVHAICGENGAGKSTLMNVLSGVYPYGSYEGDIEYLGEVCKFKSVRDSEKVGIAIIHQELALSPYLSVAENIFLGNENRKGFLIDWDTTRANARKLLTRVGLDVNVDTPVGELGVGKQQLIEIAKALSKEVKLLILDEPTAALNDEDSAHLLDLMRSLRDEGVSMIIISHKLNEIAAIADSTTIIRDGQTITTLDMHSKEGVTEDQIIKHMVGRDLSNRYPEHQASVGSDVFKIEDWTVSHPEDPSRLVLDKANLEIKAGEIVGLAGLMGAGRTELAMSIFGRSYGNYLGGKVTKNGQELNTKTVRQAIASSLAYVPEDRKSLGLNLIESIRRNTTAAALGKTSHNGVVNQHNERKIVSDFIRDLRIKVSSMDNEVSSLSGGNQQKVVLSKWIYTDPELLILDEPTRGIDVGAKFEIYQIIDRLADDGKAVLMISSELPELLGVCDRIYTMAYGRITGCLNKGDATQESLMQLMTLEKDGK
ncbi:ABC transporter ATP-binding protein [Boudabousia liubingyangii]|uniref:ABC transporter ATP-binding protein n=1 Tax=Boudabousia liubingyangii TaxID=1921764 RepID=A0A1Q5PMX3_9ACTO|nr:multiple monosaccharide ABC transporter ATP-binding protein [Boudabousia liubingyangii]OKL47455.1 ABC transporter ATP-binding protein [Boudabousia liubingyangii]OKL48877.1 ABC transporter ATP-binding protein [Boudabousia liubingyangii]